MWAGARRLGECVKDDTKVLGLQLEWAIFRDVWRDFIDGQTSNPSLAWKLEHIDVLKINGDE